MPARLEALSTVLEDLGLRLRGGFAVDPSDGLDPIKAVLMIGNAGPSMWTRFQAERRDEPDPLDRWVRRHLTPIAESLSARLAMPSDGPPYLPFQRWAMRAEPVHQSPLGLLIHPSYGLWHAYRAAFLLSETQVFPPRVETPSPCATCADRPCLDRCPVAAFSVDGYDAKACTAHLAKPAGTDCASLGCRARRACPIGEDWRPVSDQTAFHMSAFIG